MGRLIPGAGYLDSGGVIPGIGYVEPPPAATGGVTVANAAQTNTASSAAIRQTHLVAVAAASQAQAAASATIQQTHRVSGAASAQVNVATAGAVSQSTTTFVAGSHSSQANTAAAAAIRQTHLLGVANAGQANQSSVAAIRAIHLLLAAASAQANVASAVSATQNGTIVIPGVTDWSTGLLKTGETGVQVDVRALATGALIVRKTGQTTHATTGDCVIDDPLIAAAVTYEVVTRFADGSVGVWDYTAS